MADEKTGIRGRGKRGKRGHRGHRGHSGAAGATGASGSGAGATGATGPAGATGAAGSGGSGQRFLYLANGGEGEDFIVAMPVPQVGDYEVQATQQSDETPVKRFAVPQADHTTTQFRVVSSGFMDLDDLIAFDVEPLTAPIPTIPVPRLDSYTPPQGLPGDVIIIAGQFFTGATSVSVNGTNAPIFTVDNDGQITLTLPAGFTTGPITVTTPAGTGFGPPFTLASWAVGAMNVAREFFAFATLLDGRIIAAGGAPDGSGGGPYLTSAEIFDPTTGVWTLVASMAQERSVPIFTLLPNGHFLVAGGADNTNTALASAEIYNPTSNTWAPTGSMTIPRVIVSNGGSPSNLIPITVGPNAGNVLASFGSDAAGANYNQSEIYAVGAGTWGQVVTTGARFSANTIALATGEILAVAARSTNGTANPAELVARWQPGSNTWSPAATMLTPVTGSELVRLDAGFLVGNVVVAGGHDDTNTSQSALYFYDPTGDAWAAGPFMTEARQEFAFGYMSDGRIIAAGGVEVGVGFTDLVEFFDQTTLSLVEGPNLNIAQDSSYGTGGFGAVSVNGFFAIFGGADAGSGANATARVQIYVGPP